jgi:hypothetical protein
MLMHLEDHAEKVAIRLRLAAGHRLYTTPPQVLKFTALDSEKIDTSVPQHESRYTFPAAILRSSAYGASLPDTPPSSLSTYLCFSRPPEW